MLVEMFGIIPQNYPFILLILNLIFLNFPHLRLGSLNVIQAEDFALLVSFSFSLFIIKFLFEISRNQYTPSILKFLICKFNHRRSEFVSSTTSVCFNEEITMSSLTMETCLKYHLIFHCFLLL